jgi:hypothetical protein
MKNQKPYIIPNSSYDVSICSPSMLGDHRLKFRCMTPWRFIPKSHFYVISNNIPLFILLIFLPQILIMIYVIPIPVI